MSNQTQTQETMKIVAQAYDIVGRFHRNVAELFRATLAEMETREPAYGAWEGGAVLTGEVTRSLRGAGSWCIKHLALPLVPLDDEDAPLLLLHIAVDKSFSEVPEVWLGSFSSLESFRGESFPFEETISYIFQDYFGPEDDWTEAGKWYEVEFEDEVVSVNIGFCRLPLERLVDREAIRREVCDRLIERVEALLEADESEDEE